MASRISDPPARLASDRFLAQLANIADLAADLFDVLVTDAKVVSADLAGRCQHVRSRCVLLSCRLRSESFSMEEAIAIRDELRRVSDYEYWPLYYELLDLRDEALRVLDAIEAMGMVVDDVESPTTSLVAASSSESVESPTASTSPSLLPPLTLRTPA